MNELALCFTRMLHIQSLIHKYLIHKYTHQLAFGVAMWCGVFWAKRGWQADVYVDYATIRLMPLPAQFSNMIYRPYHEIYNLRHSIVLLLWILPKYRDALHHNLITIYWQALQCVSTVHVSQKNASTLKRYIARNFKDRFWWYLAEIFKILQNRVCMLQFSCI